MFRPVWRYLIWFLLSLWFALGISGISTPADVQTYAQVRALATFSFDTTPYLPETLAFRMNDRPGPALAALPFYLIGRMIGAAIGDDPTNVFGWTAQITALSASVAMALALAFLLQTGLALGLRKYSALIMVVIAAIATPLCPYGSRLAPPAFGMLALAMMLYALLRIGQRDDRAVLRLMLGAGLGLALLLGDEFLIALPLFMLWTLARIKRILGRPTWAFSFIVPFSLGIFVFAFYNMSVGGGWLNAANGQPLWDYLWREYIIRPTLHNRSYWSRHLWPGLKLVLFGDGPMPTAMAMSRELPQHLRNVILRGIFIWCPLLAIGFAGGWSLSRDPDTKGPLRLLMLIFAFALFMRAVALQIAPPLRYDLGAILPFLLPWLLGVGFFIEFHLLSMRGWILRTLYVFALIFTMIFSLGNAAIDTAGKNLGAKPSTLLSLLGEPAPALPTKLGANLLPDKPLPPMADDVFFLPTKMAADWLTQSPGQVLATFCPGLNNLPLYVALLALIALLPLLAAIWARRRADRLAESVAAQRPPRRDDDDDEPKFVERRKKRTIPDEDRNADTEETIAVEDLEANEDGSSDDDLE